MDLASLVEARLIGFAAGVLFGTVVLAVRIAFDRDARRGLFGVVSRRRSD